MTIKYAKNPMSGDPCFLDEEKGLFYGWIVGGIVWPTENPGAVVIVGQEDVWRPPRQAHVLAEFEDKTIGDLIRRCSYLTKEFCADDFYGRPDKICLRYVDQFNSEARQNRMKRFNFISAPSCDLPMDYHFNLLRDRLAPGKKSIHFPEGSQLKGQLLSVPDDQVITEDALYPLVSALSYAVAALIESESVDRSNPRKTFSNHEYDVLNY